MARSGPRIVGGAQGGRSLRVPGGARPTEGRVREALFNIWSELVPEARFLDLFAGSGAVGLEAASRGASRVTLVEGDGRAVGLLRRNVEDLAVGDRVRIRRMRLPRDLKRRSADLGAPYDLAFADPPYAFDEYPALLRAAAPHVVAGGELAVEHAAKTVLQPEDGAENGKEGNGKEGRESFSELGWELLERRSWGDCAVSFLRRESPSRR